MSGTKEKGERGWERVEELEREVRGLEGELVKKEREIEE